MVALPAITETAVHQRFFRFFHLRHVIQAEQVQAFHRRGTFFISIIRFLQPGQKLHIAVIVEIQASPERPVGGERMLMKGELPATGVLGKKQEGKRGGIEIVEREQQIHIPVPVKVITMDIRHLQVFHQCLLPELLVSQIDPGIYPLVLRVIIDIIRYAVAVQIFHGQLARLRRGYKPVVSQVIKNRAKSNQIHQAVTVHVEGLCELIALVHRRAPSHEHAGP